ncbi:MAG: hypothetical protein QY307_01450 [Acidimicrobiia bacterium]|nr:MAG: hypothetical protein QY307_01450 [Acidimicrobiia bacterium]
MIGVEADLVEQVGGDDPPLLLVGLLPDLLDVEIGEMPGDVLEGLGDLVSLLQPLGRLRQFGFEPPELHGEIGFLFGEELGADPPGVVQVEELPASFPELFGESGGPGRPPPGSRPGRPPQLAPNRLLQRLVVPHDPQTQQGGPLDSGHRPSRLLAALPPMHAPEEALAPAVPVDAGHPTTQPASHHTGEGVAALTTATLDPAPLGPFPIFLGEQSLVVAGEPLAPPDHLAEVDPGLDDPLGRRVLDPGTPFDLGEGAAFGTEPEDPPHRVGVTVRSQVAVNEVVAGLGPVDPLALLGGFGHAHDDVLGELFPVELSERAEHVVEHPPRCRGQVQPFGEGVQSDVGLPEGVGQEDQVSEVPGEAIQAPHQQVLDVALFDHGEDLLQPGTFEILPRGSGVFDEGDGAEVVEVGVGPQLVGLALDGVALGGLLLGGDPAVRHGQHDSSSSPRRFRRIRRLTVTSTDATRS